MKKKQHTNVWATALLAVVVAIVISWGLFTPETKIKKLTIKTGQEVREVISVLAEGQSLMIDLGKIPKTDFPKGVHFLGGSIVGISREDGELTITLIWNNEKDRYETNVSFEPRG